MGPRLARHARIAPIRRACRQSEASFRLLFAANPLPMFVYDLATLYVLEVNDAAVTHYGRAAISCTA